MQIQMQDKILNIQYYLKENTLLIQKHWNPDYIMREIEEIKTMQETRKFMHT